MGVDKNSWKICLLLIFLVLIILSSNSFFVSAQAEEEQKSWFSGIIEFFKSLFNTIFQINENITENATEINELNKSEEINISVNETVAQENLTIEINNITNTSNITCGNCQYLVNDTCLNYSCCNDSDCGVNQTCLEHECVDIEISCPPCPAPEISPTTGNTCAYYYCDASTRYTPSQDFYCRREIIRPCCGDTRCDVALGENESNCPVECSNVSKFIYCEQDSDCTPCCGTVGSQDPLEIKGRGTCMNKNYSCVDYPSIYKSCGKEFVAWCNMCECINNQCVTIKTTDYRC